MPGQIGEPLAPDEELDSNDDSVAVQDLDSKSSGDSEGSVDLLQSPQASQSSQSPQSPHTEQAQRAPAGEQSSKTKQN